MNISDRIQSLRKKKGLSQYDLADEMGVSRQAVSKWENGQSIPDIEKIILLSDYFNVSTDYIIKGVEEEEEKNKKENNIIYSKILYIVSTFLITIGNISAFLNLCIRIDTTYLFVDYVIIGLGVMSYFIAKTISNSSPKFIIKFINIMMIIFTPITFMIFMIGNIIPFDVLYIHKVIVSIIIFLIIYVFLGICIFKKLKNNYLEQENLTPVFLYLI